MGTVPIIHDDSEVVDYASLEDFKAGSTGTAITYRVEDAPIITLLIRNDHATVTLDYEVLGTVRRELKKKENIPVPGTRDETSTNSVDADLTHWFILDSGTVAAVGGEVKKTINRGGADNVNEAYVTHIRLQYKPSASMVTGDVITQLSKTTMA